MAVLKVTVLSCALILLLKSIEGYKIPLEQDKGINDLVDCANKIMLNYYSKGSEVTFVDTHINYSYKNNYVLTEMHRKMHVSIISRNFDELLSFSNEGYIIYVRKCHNFVSHFKFLTREATWNPHARFTIVTDLDKSELRAVFEILLEYHVFNVLIINGNDLNLYTYNPFEDYGCGKQFNRIIDYGKCNNSSQIDLFPDKLVTGVRNCTFNIAAPNWPPYIINPSTSGSKGMGIEQFVFKIFTELEHFNTNYTYNNDAENFTVINEGLAAVGPLDLLQKNEADVIFGGMMLIKSRADVFDFIFSHLAFVDEIKLMVKKAGDVQPWKNVYLEFRPLVWMLLVISFLIYFLFLIVIIRGADKTSILLKMWDSLFTHGHTISQSHPAKCAFIIWIWFAYLVNSFYQSNLFSLSTHPAKDYQISKEQDLKDYHLKPCMSNVMQTLMWAELGIPMNNITYDCEPLLQSIRTVTDGDSFYTITIYSIFAYNRYKFVDNYGNSLLYEFPTLNKVMYAMYFYKGFPLLGKFHTYALRLRESGLIQKVSEDLYYEEWIKHYYSKYDMRFRVYIPWFIYLVGASSAGFVFVLELVLSRRNVASLV